MKRLLQFKLRIAGALALLAVLFGLRRRGPSKQEKRVTEALGGAVDRAVKAETAAKEAQANVEMAAKRAVPGSVRVRTALARARTRRARDGTADGG